MAVWYCPVRHPLLNLPPMNAPRRLSRWALSCLLILIPLATVQLVVALEPIPNGLVVLTFDDSVASQHSVVWPLLKRYGFGATFFITEGFSFRTNKQDYMTWDQIRELHEDGFEIGNHTKDHLGVAPSTLGQLRGQVEFINQRCAEHGIPRPTSFAYPGNALTPGALPILKDLGIRFARRGGAPEHPYDWGKGFAYEPGKDHPLLIPSAGDARPDWTLSDFKRAVDQARDGRIAVLQFHGVPDRDHPWVNTFPERFEQYLKYLHDQRCRVIAMRDLEMRGTGDILGFRQSGKTKEVGISLYFQLLEEKVDEIRHGKRKDEKCKIELDLSYAINDEYFDSELDKLSFFRDIDSIETLEDLDYAESTFRI